MITHRTTGRHLLNDEVNSNEPIGGLPISRRSEAFIVTNPSSSTKRQDNVTSRQPTREMRTAYGPTQRVL